MVRLSRVTQAGDHGAAFLLEHLRSYSFLHSIHETTVSTTSFSNIGSPATQLLLRVDQQCLPRWLYWTGLSLAPTSSLGLSRDNHNIYDSNVLTLATATAISSSLLHPLRALAAR